MTTNQMTTNQTPAKQGVRARERNALERISDLEQRLSVFADNTRQSFEANDKNVTELVEVMSAVVRVLGAEVVAKTLIEIQAEKAKAEAEEGKAALQARVDAGELVSSTVVTEECLITGLERNADGTEVAPGYVQLVYAGVKPEYQTKLLALKVGDSIDTENDRKFEITGIYVLAQKAE